MEEGYYIRAKIVDLPSKKSVMIETRFYFPIGPQATFKVKNFLGQLLTHGTVFKDSGNVESGGITRVFCERYTAKERRMIALEAIEQSELVLELPDWNPNEPKRNPEPYECE
ncbi:hypothetical protein [Leptospira stimsonii]|uniref:Uncharacterized protein n=1 Tax=Leptospira stimsonii TaxID=2202203 RepID=A0ABY2N8V6_9LEPT|nr:hypothetical protein [Leptospira stimsonii]TGK12845.1 hypothetical protein EHO98_19595 [Leptospira stimsonii]TGM18779.1 hypothetical protein EHQ90_06450 [Leptospira stimsonii]